ncbi:MAG: barstar family protein [Oscillospiraceae bacterium]|jgi:ribonuclease inhibitor|nr:barstar family protein [Oscillospiraceae bacterium]
METIRLDGAQLQNRKEAMELLGQALALPKWWGRNLDALYDCLTDLGRPVRLEISRREAMEASAFGRLLLRVLEDAAAEQFGLELSFDRNDSLH